ncbi:MAG: hypothetical protein SFV32_01675 [Opitutaceae bacterium]|nr:hypothetical protein [Opitutaceae bacterium]
MKRLILILTLTAALPGLSLIAEDAPPAPPGPAARAEEAPSPRQVREKVRSELKHLAETLQLDDAQKKMVRSIIKERREQMKTLAPEQRRGEAGQRLRADSHAKIRALLTPDQQTKFDKWAEDMKAKHKGQGKRARKGPNAAPAPEQQSQSVNQT